MYVIFNEGLGDAGEPNYLTEGSERDIVVGKVCNLCKYKMYNINYKRVRRRLPRLQFTSLNIHYQMFHVKCFALLLKRKKLNLTEIMFTKNII